MPVIPGMRWSTSISPTALPRRRSCSSAPSASVPDAAVSTRYSALKWRRRSRSIAPRTSRSSSTASRTGLATARALLELLERGLDLRQREPRQADDAGMGAERRRHDRERLRLVVHVHEHPRAVHAAL